MQNAGSLRLPEIIVARHAAEFSPLVEDGETGDFAPPRSLYRFSYREGSGQRGDVPDHGVGHMKFVQEVFGFVVGQRDPVL